MSTTSDQAMGLDALHRDFRGEIIEPGDPAYDAAARTVLAGGSPDRVLLPVSVADVQAAVRYAVTAGLPISVRGGGHSFPGFGTSDGGVVLDLRHLAGVDVVDADRGLVRVGGGATWGSVADALAPVGLAISSGDTRSVGVGGLTLSGGIGWKARKYGLALDQLVAAEVVTADGELVRASRTEHPELFWALRGGGGNFGAVTAFEFAAHQTTDVFFGTITFPAAEATRVLLGWAEYFRTAPEELTANVVLANAFTGGPEAPVEFHVAYDGDDADLARDALAPVRGLGTVLSDDVRPMPYAEILEEGMVPPPGIGFAVRSGFAGPDTLPDVLRILAGVATSERPPIIAMRSVGGAVSRVADDATAYAHRRAAVMIATMVAGPPPVLHAATPAMDRIWGDLRPHVSGAYGNFLSSATEQDVAAIYPPRTYQRLARVKHRYDPANVFARNHNVPPAT